MYIRHITIRSSLGGRLMSRGPQSFTQSDIIKALKAAQKAGFYATRFEIDQAGKIIVFAGKPADLEIAQPANEWDSVK